MANPVYRSLYWRIALGFMLCVAGVLALQAVIVIALLNRTDVAAGDTLTQAASGELARVLSIPPRRDLQQYLNERFPRPPQSLLAVLADGQVLTAGSRRASDRVVESALRELHRPVRSIPKSWQGEPFHASPIVVDGAIVGAVAVVPETWVQRLWPALLATSVGLLVIGTTLASVFIFGPAHRRLKELESAALRLGAGDMRARARDDGGDEVARVARAFNQMAADLAVSDRAKLEGGGDSLDLQDVSVEGLFGRVAARHAPHAAAKALTFSTTIAPGAEIVYGDRFRLEQALQNLAANAIRHAPHGGRVELGAELRTGGTALTVTDSGPGIAAEHLAFVFDRFYKADPARSGDSGGSGLGLSIVRAIVERHGGTVSVSSELGADTVFTIWLPAASSGAAWPTRVSAIR